jgi:microcystin degradation protein MlrC
MPLTLNLTDATGLQKARKRVLLGQIFQEAHGFTPLTTALEAFVIELGDEVLSANENAQSVLGGLIRTGRAFDWALIPSIAARASPGGRVTNSAYTYIKEQLLASARQSGFDAIALCLHGCMQTESLDCAEADLIASLRAIVGPHIPIVSGFDLHANAGGELLRHLDFASAYKTNPHADAGQTGDRVAQVLQQIFEGNLKPVGVKVLVPMLTCGNDETTQGPLANLHKLARTTLANDSNLLDASIFNVNPFIDGKCVGQTTVVFAKNKEGLDAAIKLAQRLADGLWASRKEFKHSLPSLTETIRNYSNPCLVLGDFGDRVLAGGPGDSTYIVRKMQALHPELLTVAPLTDPEALQICLESGVGRELTLQLGGAYTPEMERLTLHGKVLRSSTDETAGFRNRGSFMQGATLRIGPYAVFAGENFCLLLTRDPVMSQDPGCFIDCGIDLSTANIIVAKSGYHFKLAFGGYGPCICVETPGLTVYTPSANDFIKARPLFPIDEFEFAPIAQIL